MNLAVGDGNVLYYEEHGNPDGVPAVFLHGGPGSGFTHGALQYFDLDRFRVVLYDQRNCGRSTPHASDVNVSLEHNRIKELLEDLSALRTHLGVARWLMVGHSFGTTLGLAYAQTWPETLLGLVVIGGAIGTAAEVAWIYGGIRADYPQQWKRFVAILDDEERGDVIAAYHRRLNDADAAVRDEAALHWSEWDWATSSVTPTPLPTEGRWADPAFRLARARICTHYFTADVRAAEDQLTKPHHLARLQSVAGVIINGEFDMLDSARTLHALWPRADLVVVDAAGHSTAEAGMLDAIRAATDRFAN